MVHGTLLITLFLFEACSQGASGESQRFRELPEGVLVSEGGDVELRCAVDYQRGKAQWTKDGFALGFERNVPGYPRYQYKGDSQLGEHHLVIKGVTLQDDGEYQCQVGPTNEAPPIWSAANVTVLVAPASINIVGWGDGSVVEVIAGTSLSLECVVTDARPAPSLTWYRDGIELDRSKQRDEFEAGSRPRLMNIRSRLLVQAVPADDNQQFSCRGHHPALNGVTAALVASITLSVLHKPKSPVISGYTEGEVLVSGQRITILCKSVGGNPKPLVLWYRNEEMVDDSTVLEDKTVVNKMEMVVTSSDDEALLKCRVTNDLLKQPLVVSVSLTVHYAPALLTIEGESSIAIGDNLNLRCTTAPSNPPSKIHWIIQGKKLQGESYATKKDEEGGWISSSEIITDAITKEIASEGSHIVVICKAVNHELDEIVTKEHVVAIVKPPGLPVLKEILQPVIANSEVQFVCYSIGGNPPPSISIFKSGELLLSKVKQLGDKTEVNSKSMVQAKDNGKDVTCEVNHLASKEPLSVSHRIKVLFAAKKIVGRALPAAVDEGDQTVLSCDSSSSNPPSNITWKSNGQRIEGSTQYHSHSEHYGKATRSELVVRAKSGDDGRIYTCSASNGIPHPIISTNISISVRHSPVWVIKPPDQIDVYEGKDLVVRAVAAANPGPLRYWWRKGTETLPSVDGSLHMNNIRRSDSGNYTVTASSVRGMINSSFMINVQYSPEFVSTVPNITIAEGESTSVACSAKGNPSPKIIWSRNNNVALATGVTLARLKVQRATTEDIGEYICTATNGVDLPVLVKTKLIVTHKPKILNESRHAKGTWAETGGSAVLSCRVLGAPRPNFEWTTRDGQLLTNNTKYRILGPQLIDGLTLWVSTIEIFKVVLEDYDAYVCEVNNALGADTMMMSLNPPDKPEPPSSFRVINTTSSTISLAWRRNDASNGPVHRYTIRYKNEHEKGYKEVHLSPEETSVTIGNLYPGSRYLVTSYSSNTIGDSILVEPPLLVVLPDIIQNVVDQRSSISSNSRTDDSGVSIGGWRVPRLVLLITCLTGATLLILNIAIIACFVKRRNARNLSKTRVGTSDHPAGIVSLSNEEKDLMEQGVGAVNEVLINGCRKKTSSSPVLVSQSSHNKAFYPCTLNTSSSPLVVHQSTSTLNTQPPDMPKTSLNSQSSPASAEHRVEQDQMASFSNIDSSTETRLPGYAFSDSGIHCQLLSPNGEDGCQASQSSMNDPTISMNTGHIMFSSNKMQQQSDKYTSLSAANLCQYEAPCFNNRYCNQTAEFCPCKNISTEPIMSYATLGPRTRKMSTPHFSTLQRTKRHDTRYTPQSFDSVNIPNQNVPYENCAFDNFCLGSDSLGPCSNGVVIVKRDVQRTSSLKSYSRNEVGILKRPETTSVRKPTGPATDKDSDSDSYTTTKEVPKMRPKSVLKNPNRSSKSHGNNEVHFAGNFVYPIPSNNSVVNGSSRTTSNRAKFPQDYIKQTVEVSSPPYSLES